MPLSGPRRTEAGTLPDQTRTQALATGWVRVAVEAAVVVAWAGRRGRVRAGLVRVGGDEARWGS
jgi:hypothetical protein